MYSVDNRPPIREGLRTQVCAASGLLLDYHDRKGRTVQCAWTGMCAPSHWGRIWPPHRATHRTASARPSRARASRAAFAGRSIALCRPPPSRLRQHQKVLSRWPLAPLTMLMLKVNDADADADDDDADLMLMLILLVLLLVLMLLMLIIMVMLMPISKLMLMLMQLLMMMLMLMQILIMLMLMLTRKMLIMLMPLL